MPEMYIGKRTWAGYKPEAIYGTSPADPLNVWIGKIQSVTPTEDANWLDVNVVDDQNDRNVTQRHTMHTALGGNITFFLQYGTFFRYAWGDVDTSGPGPFTNTVSEANTLPSFTLHTGHIHSTATFGRKYLGCVVNNLEVSFSAGNPVEVSLDFVAQNTVKFNTDPNITAVATPPYMGHQTKVEINIGAGFVEVTEVNSGSFSISNELVHPEYVNDTLGRKKGEPIPTIRLYEATFNINARSSTYWDEWLLNIPTDSTIDVRITMTRDVGTDTATFYLNNCVIVSSILNSDIGEDVAAFDLVLKPKNTSCVFFDTLEYTDNF